MDKLKCIIIDDEQGAHLVMNHYLSTIKTASLVASFYNVIDALDYMYNNNVDIIFLDINMPGISGIEMLEILSIRPNIIITTAYKEYALDSYKYEVVDYLVKPFELKKVLAAIDKVINRINAGKQVPTLSNVEHLILKVDGSYVKLNFSDILYIQSYGNYVKVFTSQKMLLSQITTSEIEEKLDNNLFVRIHKSYIISIKHTNEIRGKQAFMSNNVILPIGNTFKRDVYNYFKKK